MEISRVWRTPNMISWDMNWQPFDLWMSEHGDFSPQFMIPSEPSNHNWESTMILMAQKKPLPPQHFVLEHLLQTHTLMFFGTPSLCSTLIQHLVSFFLVRSLVPSTASFRIRMARRCFQHPMANPRYNCGPLRRQIWSFLSRENHRTEGFSIAMIHDQRWFTPTHRK